MKLRRFLLVAALAFASFSARAQPLIVGYFPFWASYSHGAALSDAPVEKLTHLVYAVASLQPDGSVTSGDFFADQVRVHAGDDNQLYRGNYALIPQLKARNPRLKVLLSVGGWARSTHFSDVAADGGKRARFVATALAMMDKHGFDGIEFDWRFPVVGGAEGTGKRPDDLANYRLLMHEMRQACDARKRPCTLSLTLSPQASMRPGWRGADLFRDVDFATLIASDFYGEWSTSTGHKSPLLPDPAHPGPSVAGAVADLKAGGVDTGKLVLLLPAQGASWLGVPPTNHGLYQPFKGVPFGTWDADKNKPTGLFTYNEITKLDAAGGFERNWDDVAKAETLYQPQTGQLISFESPRALAAKLEFIDQQGLAGVGLWETSSDAPGDAALLEQAWRHYHPWLARWASVREHAGSWLPWLGAALAGLLAAGLLFWRLQRRGLRQLEHAQHARLLETLNVLPDQLLLVAQQVVRAKARWPDRLPVVDAEQLDLVASSSLAIRHQLLPLAAAIAPDAVRETPTRRDALLELERFTRQLSEQRSLERMLETMLRFVADDERVCEATLLEEETQEAPSGDLLQLDATRTAATVRHASFADYGVALRFHTELSDEEEVYFRSLANQLVLVRQQLHELARQPQLLAELYEIAYRREKLHFIRADKGYSGIYASDLAAPHYVTLRLRAIRLYFGELVQVHRSYLVRPKSVSGYRRGAGGGMELVIAGQGVPVARTYLPQLKRQFPAWFRTEVAAAACSS
ncbi:Chitinase, GH18 family [Andreprevotia lacus DSM 23236]|uniref:chitinase n=1 Tax=Andreprevotia lacus DSM 23236 TaxID=1121001 RepID=A0A1W1X2S7_9NEIS|nr:glycosyl hydrolase family 18 protein [Andreprevotia lacus]SMC18070.1 Chitinase, GH18 family [Andreprevotia lacus DSM 23236]